ncbi:MAG: hypothetical protein LBH95_01625 [Oscillospiraceae bacterium]|nr:hypothetical protein [Oscillospiraceae bacterium]
MKKTGKRICSFAVMFALIILFGSGARPQANAVSQQIIIENMYTDMSRYDPGTDALIHIDVSNADSFAWAGTLTVTVYHLDSIVYQTNQMISVNAESSDTFCIRWTTPNNDFMGYLAKAQIDDSYKTTAIDVSSDFSVYPRYGYIPDFPETETQYESEKKIRELSQKYNINALQYYDWMWRHDALIKRTAGQIDATWVDLFGRTISTDTLFNQINAAKSMNVASMAYVMSYAAREEYDQYGVLPQWGIFKDRNHLSQFEHDFFYGIYLWFFNPANAGWQDFITGQYLDAIQTMGFDGLQIDQMGQRDNVYDYTGSPVYLQDTFSSLINAAKTKLASADSKLTFNVVDGTVDGWGLSDIMANANTDFDYSELWWKSNSYNDLRKYIEQFRGGNGGKALVLAAYMNYGESTGIRYEAENAALNAVSVNMNHAGYTGAGFVDQFASVGDSVTFTISMDAPGLCPLVFRYANATDYVATRNIYIDGVFFETLSFYTQNDWDSWLSEYCVPYLQQGVHTVSVRYDVQNQHAINLDSLTLGYFDDHSVRLADAAMAASGASHIELGANPHEAVMLVHEYYPNTSKVMSKSLSDSMERHYDFITAYENLLYDGDITYGDAGTQNMSISGHTISGSGENGKIWALFRQKFDYDMIHLINLTSENDTLWRNSTGQPGVLTNLQTKYYIGPDAVVSGVYIASPDTGECLTASLPYTMGVDSAGTYISFTVPSLEYWDMIYIKRTIDTTGLYEAEKAVKVGVQVNNNHSGYSGTGFVDMFDRENTSVTFTVRVDTDGQYRFRFKHANATGDLASRALFVDDGFEGIVYFGSLANWDTWGSGDIYVDLKAGVHKVVLLYGVLEYTPINLDCLIVEQ